MPEERKESFLSIERLRLSPSPLEDDENIKEWDDARCPVCMEHPHNAILLMCSSHEKGCCPFMCDTSYRQSNCFDRFRKSSGVPSEVLRRPEEMPNFSPPLSSATTIESAVSDLEGERSPERSSSLQIVPCENPVKTPLVCPLCRGSIVGWTVVKNARSFMNGKSRSCACETCDFNGTYTDLRNHATLVHPFVRPTIADPERLRNWRILELRRDYEDSVSTLLSSTGNTLIINTLIFLARLIEPGNTSSGSSTSRARAQVALRRRPWGESIDRELDSRVDNNESAESGQGLPRQYARRNYLIPEDENESEDSGQEFVRNVRRRTF